MAQLNIRIDDSLKQRGDRVFEQHGLTPSSVVRAVWQYAADHKELPSFIHEASKDGQLKKREQRQLLAEAGAGMATKLLELSPIPQEELTYEELRELAYLERLEISEY